MSEAVLKGGAALLTVLAAAAAGAYVASHVHSRSAPLHPSVVAVSPAVPSGDEQPLTTTYVS
jgi:hypothetical protein